MKKGLLLWLLLICAVAVKGQQDTLARIRINQLGYLPHGVKAAVWGAVNAMPASDFQLVDAATGKVVFTGIAGKDFGRYGPFNHTCRLDFTGFTATGVYYLRSGATVSPFFRIGSNVYAGAADFLLRYMRQQRSGFNPFLKDSCHTRDGYTMYGPMPDSTHIDVTGGWHDASDYLQYVTTSANAAWHLLAAYRDFPASFGDQYSANGLSGSNRVKDVLDEARWGLDWLLKMHPSDNYMFNQVADDRDHHGMRLPGEDNFYGKGFERPVYFCTGQPQGLGKYKNRSTGVASTAGKFASAFALGYQLLRQDDPVYAAGLYKRAFSAYNMGLRQPGVCQTASTLSPYIYAEDNWTDDMELAAASLSAISRQSSYAEQGWQYAQQEKITPWLGRDTASHYQWYPFVNAGHYALAMQLKGARQQELTGYYRTGIIRVWQKAQQNAFYRGVPFIWCSNNLTVSFAIQCYWYRQLSGDASFTALEQANTDWLFGCNPWGTSMVYGLPANGDTPEDPHSAFSHLGYYPVDGGLVDGPVYTSIYKSLIGIRLAQPDEYAAFQSNLAVYHDDNGDYSTNEPTMDGTASLVYLLAAKDDEGRRTGVTAVQGGIIRGDTTRKTLALVFTGDEFADGGTVIQRTLQRQRVPAAFFLTGRFYANPAFRPLIKQLKAAGHYLGPHSDQHLLYCDWKRRDSLLVSKDQFLHDMAANYQQMEKAGIKKITPAWFLPAYEWYNDSIAAWTREAGAQLICFTPGTRSNADYTYPAMGKSYQSSEAVYQSVMNFEAMHTAGLNGFILLLHIGTDPRRTDKFYDRLDNLVTALKGKGYRFVPLSELLK